MEAQAVNLQLSDLELCQDPYQAEITKESDKEIFIKHQTDLQIYSVLGVQFQFNMVYRKCRRDGLIYIIWDLIVRHCTELGK